MCILTGAGVKRVENALKSIIYINIYIEKRQTNIIKSTRCRVPFVFVLPFHSVACSDISALFRSSMESEECQTSKTILKQSQKTTHGLMALFSVLWRLFFSCPATAVNQLCGPSRLTASVLVRSRVPVFSVRASRGGAPRRRIARGSEGRVCLWQFPSFNIAWTNH